MANSRNNSPLNYVASAPNPPPPTPSASAQSKRNNRRPNRGFQQMAHADGSVSDSVTLPSASPRPKRQPKQPSPNGTPVNGTNNYNHRSNNTHPRAVPISHLTPTHPATPLKEHAYAGATFQASPAPSSLPVPKFFSKSMLTAELSAPASSVTTIASDCSSEADRSTDYSTTPSEPPPRAHQHSPLDILFEAQRAETAKRRDTGASLSPNTARQILSTTTSNRPASSPGRNAFLRELDGDDSDLSPAHPSTSQPIPFNLQQRSGSFAATSGSHTDHAALAQAMKDLLNNNVKASSHGRTAPPPSAQFFETPDISNGFSMPLPPYHSPSAPTTPAAYPPQTSQHDYYSLHYGNRNLSPLFKAAVHEKSPAPKQPAQPQNAYTPPFDGQHIANPMQYPRANDSNDFSRANLARHIHAVRSPQPPAKVPPAGQSVNHRNHQQAYGSNERQPRVLSPPFTDHGQEDTKALEDSLRRISNLNIFSN